MSNITTDDLAPFPHVVLVYRAGRWSVRRFLGRDQAGQFAAHDYAERQALSRDGGDSVVIVAAQYRELGSYDAKVALGAQEGVAEALEYDASLRK